MGEAIGQAISLGIPVTISPIPIIAVVLMLDTPRARTNGPAFVVGWLVGLSLLGTLVVLIAAGADASDDGGPARWTGWVRIVLGVALLALAARQWRARPRSGDGELPSWMATVDAFRPPRAAAMGVLLSTVNPKNLLITVAAATAIAQSGVDAGEEVIAMAVFVVVATIGPTIPVALFFVLGARAKDALDELRGWMARNNTAIMAVIVLVIGAKLVGDGLGVVVR